MVKIAVNGALGRMGSRILNLAYQSRDFQIVGVFEHAENEHLGKSMALLLGLTELSKLKLSAVSSKALKGCQVLIDFSSPPGTRKCLEAALRSKTAMVIGTTGLGPDGEEAIRRASKRLPLLFSPNMSIGANFLFELARTAAARLKAGYDIEIIEAHHRLKKDAPSGTAKKIAEVIAKEKGWDLDKVARFGRQGVTGERANEEIGIHAVRAGDIVGDHTVLLSGAGESIEITHRAHSRDAFARGALAAAAFLAGRPKGLYDMQDVLK
ncbi:MAG: 4-hydroxy-tetrahydrodipicolinate reductase [Candidatus Omnitrophica bacterium]|nr:4-hydroxy-tetrahydrodipicolinate reductase [Candidatus Omnitrophota bacterium]